MISCNSTLSPTHQPRKDPLDLYKSPFASVSKVSRGHLSDCTIVRILADEASHHQPRVGVYQWGFGLEKFENDYSGIAVKNVFLLAE